MSHTPSKEELQSALEQYDTLLIQRVETGQAKGAKDLHDLDGQLWSKMSLALRESNAPSVNLAELKEVMRYKLARGKFRPTLPSLIASNDDSTVRSTTRSGFESYSTTSADSSLKTLCKLKGVGPATASLLLSLCKPTEEAFMSDESWECLESLKGKRIGYTERDWKVWRDAIRKRKEEEGWESAMILERACWAHMRLQQSGAGKSEEEDARIVAPAAKRKSTIGGAQQSNGSTSKRSKPSVEKAASGNSRTTRRRAAKD